MKLMTHTGTCFQASSPQNPVMPLRRLSWLLAAAGLVSLPAFAQVAATALPTGGVVSSGSAAISQAGAALQVNQTSQKAIIDWQSFNIGRDAAVRFNQPSSSAIALNRVGADGGRSIIEGRLSANGQVWLLNPGGVFFGPNSRVQVGGLLASSLKLGNEDFLSGNYRFSQDGAGDIVNQGTLSAADGGYIALLAPQVRNDGVITARLGTVALASGKELRVDFSGDRLIEIKVDEADVQGLIDNKNLVTAEGGWVLMSTDAASRLAQGAINNTGIVRATTLSEQGGVIKLLGGTTTVDGTLDASAPQGGNGGFIETSGYKVKVADSAKITTAAPQGKVGTWLIDPNDFVIANSGIYDMNATSLGSFYLSSGDVVIQSASGSHSGNGDIFVNDYISWTSGNKLTLDAERHINLNANIYGETAGTILSLKAGGDVVSASGTKIDVHSLAIQSAGNVNLLGGSYLNTLAANLSGAGKSFNIQTENNLNIGSVDGISGVTTNGLVTINTSAGNLSVSQNINAGSGNIFINTPGTLTIGSGSAVSTSGQINYRADDMALYGTTSAQGTADIYLAPYTAARSIHIESTPTSGVLSLTPAELATLQTPAGVSGSLAIVSNGGNFSISAPLTPSQLNADYIHFNAGNVNISAPIDATGKTFTSNASGTLTVYGSGSVNAGKIIYKANDMTLSGSTTSAAELTIASADSARPIVIGSSPTSGALSLTPAELATLNATSAYRIAVGPSSVGPLTVDAALDSSHIHAGGLALNGSSITINAPITFNSGTTALDFLSGSGGVTLNAPVTVNNSVFFLLSSGNVQQTASAPLTAHKLLTYGSGTVQLDRASNSVSAVTGSLTSAFSLTNGNTPITITSGGSISGLTAWNILLATGSNLTLNAPLTATGTSDVSTHGTTWTDPQCTGPCVRPHIELSTKGAFINNAGATALTLPAGKFWSLQAVKPSLTTLNGLTPTAVSYDASSITGDILLSANRIFYAEKDPIPPTPTPVPTPVPTPKPTAPTSTTAPVTVAETTVTQASSSGTVGTASSTPTGGIGSGGVTLTYFPTSSAGSPPPKLILDATKALPKLAGVLDRSDLQAMLQRTREARSKLYADALLELAKSPTNADIPDCLVASEQLCIAKPTQKTARDYDPSVKRKVALLIGNNAYRSPIPALETAINDVTAIGAQLRDKMGYEVKIVENATRRDIVAALNDLIRNTDRDDSVLVMYAGHGYLQESTQTGYWIPTDASASSADQWISNNTIARALRNIPAKQVMLVSDSCYSGTLTKEGKVTKTVGKNRQKALTQRSVLAMSSGGEEPVSDEGHDNHSIFAWNMIEALRRIEGDVSGQELHAQIKEAVTREFPQVPEYGMVVSAGHTEGGEYLLMPKN